MVRCSPARPASRRPRSPALRGRNPSKQNRSTGSPDTARAVSTALGPGTAVTVMPCSTAAATSRKPGSETLGIPASVASTTRSPDSSASTSAGRAGGLVALEVGHHPTADGDAEITHQPLEAAGVLGRDHVGRGELLGEPRRRVGDPADRGRREDEHTGLGHVAIMSGAADYSFRP